MSRYRLTPALVVSAMIAGVIAKTVDNTPPTNQPLRRRMQPTTKPKTGCRQAFCRQKERCHCTCKRCKTECLFRDVKLVERDGGYVLEHSDGKLVTMQLADDRIVTQLTKEDFESLPAPFKKYITSKLSSGVNPV